MGFSSFSPSPCAPLAAPTRSCQLLPWAQSTTTFLSSSRLPTCWSLSVDCSLLQGTPTHPPKPSMDVPSSGNPLPTSPCSQAPRTLLQPLLSALLLDFWAVPRGRTLCRAPASLRFGPAPGSPWGPTLTSPELSLGYCVSHDIITTFHPPTCLPSPSPDLPALFPFQAFTHPVPCPRTLSFSLVPAPGIPRLGAAERGGLAVER